jgi:hypothetical protein
MFKFNFDEDDEKFSAVKGIIWGVCFGLAIWLAIVFVFSFY